MVIRNRRCGRYMAMAMAGVLCRHGAIKRC